MICPKCKYKVNRINSVIMSVNNKHERICKKCAQRVIRAMDLYIMYNNRKRSQNSF